MGVGGGESLDGTGCGCGGESKLVLLLQMLLAEAVMFEAGAVLADTGYKTLGVTVVEALGDTLTREIDAFKIKDHLGDGGTLQIGRVRLILCGQTKFGACEDSKESM